MEVDPALSEEAPPLPPKTIEAEGRDKGEMAPSLVRREESTKKEKEKKGKKALPLPPPFLVEEGEIRVRANPEMGWTIEEILVEALRMVQHRKGKAIPVVEVRYPEGFATGAIVVDEEAVGERGGDSLLSDCGLARRTRGKGESHYPQIRRLPNRRRPGRKPGQRQ